PKGAPRSTREMSLIKISKPPGLSEVCTSTPGFNRTAKRLCVLKVCTSKARSSNRKARDGKEMKIAAKIEERKINFALKSILLIPTPSTFQAKQAECQELPNCKLFP